MNFLEKLGRLFLDFKIIYHHTKNHKKLMSSYRVKLRTDSGHFKEASIYRGPKYRFSTVESEKDIILV